MKEPIVLDSYAILALFHKERGWARVQSVLRQLSNEGKQALLSRINWGEFYYIVKRRVGKDKAEEALGLLEQLPIKVVSVDDQLIKEAAEIKSEYPIAYADAFCIATAVRAKGSVLTGDPEFNTVGGLVRVIWLD